MTHVPPSHVIEDEPGRFDGHEKAGMRRLGFEVVRTPSSPVASVSEEIRRLSEEITQTDGMKDHDVLQEMAAQRSQLTMQLPEIGY